MNFVNWPRGGKNSKIRRLAKGKAVMKSADWLEGEGKKEICRSPARKENVKFVDRLPENHLKICLSITGKNHEYI